MKVEAELAQAVRGADDLKVRWKAVRRSLEGQAADLQGDTPVQPYAFLIAGLLASLNTDAPVGDETIEQLRAAQRVLPLDSRAAFLEKVIGALSWRKRVVEEFWKALRRGDFKQGRAIYQGELVPAFGDRMPDPIRLGVLLVESETGAAAADVLLQRLTELQRDAPALNRELVEKVRTAVTEGDKVRRLGQQLKAHQFDAAADAAEKSAWAGFPAGAMPVPVALALLVARVKKEQTEQAEQLGSGIAGRPGLPVWARDYASLLLGRVLFSKKDYEAAANAFESVSSTNLLGHDTDRCWAAAQFSLGLQLLAVDQKDKAFKAFGKSLAKRGGRAENSKLAPLFIHFGLKNMEAKKGNRAKDSFQLMAQSLDGLPDSPEVTLNRLLADMGLLVCQALMDEEAKNLSGDKFRELRKRLETAGKLTITSGGRPAVVNAYLDRLFLILGVCQDLRRQVRLPTGERRKAAELYADLQPQVDALEKLRGEQEPHDPVVFTLKGCAALLWQTGPADDAMHWLEQAMALGAQSPRLAQMLHRRRDAVKKSREQKGKVLDLFDVFLASGTIPSEVKAEFIRRDDLAVLYKLNRSYVPDDFATGGAGTEVQAFASRVQHLLAFVGDDPELADHPDLKQLVAGAQESIERLTREAKEIEETERKVLTILATKIREQNLETENA